MRPHVIHWLEQLLPSSIASTIAPTWFTMVGLAGLVALFVMRRVARRNDLDPGVIATAVLWCYVAAVAAGIVVPMMIDAVEQQVATGDVALRWSGMTSFWGYLAGTAAVAIVCRDHGVPLARMGDLSTAPLGLALVLARTGCFLAGCDYGKVSSLPWAVRFPAGSPAWHDHVAAGLVPVDRAASLPVHPTQLYEALLGLAIAIVALGLARTAWARARHGRVFLAGAALYALGRIGVEALRGDAGRGVYLGLSSGQIFSLLVLAAIALGTLATRRRALHVIAAAALVALVALPRHADAQPAPAPGSQPAPAPMQPAMQPGPPAGGMVMTQPTMPPVLPPGGIPAEPARPPKAELGALVGLAFPINRRNGQVPPLGGVSVSFGYSLGLPWIWLDLDSYGNKDASHGTVLVSTGVVQHQGKLAFGGRAGFGTTLVNFDDPVFRDVLGKTVRFEALAEYELDDSWALWVRPFAIDILTAADLGGPIVTYQMRAGLAYRIGARHGHPYIPPQPSPSYYPQPYPQPQPTTGGAR